MHTAHTAHAGIEPNRRTYAAAIHVCVAAASGGPRGKASHWRRALSLLDELEAAGLQPDRVVLNSAMAACAAAARWEEALKLLGRMESAGGALKPDSTSFNTALSACRYMCLLVTL
jgi:pentatricopeptide repeat domain-containing protein 1